MGLFSRFNKSQVFSNVNTNDFTYINPKDLYEEVKDTLKISDANVHRILKLLVFSLIINHQNTVRKL